MHEVKAIFAKWRDPNHMQLHAGEMTAQEKRSVVAVLKAVEHEVSAVVPLVVAGERERLFRLLMDVYAGWRCTDGPDSPGSIALANVVHSAFPEYREEARTIIAAIRADTGGDRASALAELARLDADLIYNDAPADPEESDER